MRELRDITPGKLHLLSCRTLHSELLFVPKPKVNEIIGGVIARYQKEYGIEIFAISVLSNHYHIFCRSQRGLIHLFAENMNREIAHRINRYLKRTGPVWSRRYDDLLVLEDKDALEAFLYVSTNPTKHHLVEHARLWPGVSSWSHTARGQQKVYKFFHFSDYHAALRRAASPEEVRKSDFYSTHTLEISPLCCIKGLEKYTSERLRKLIEVRTRQLVENRKSSGKGFLGRRRVLSQSLRGVFPNKTNRSKRPVCYTKSVTALRQFREERKLLRAAYRDSSIAYRSGKFDCPFPAYTIRPAMNHVSEPHLHL